MNYRSKPTETQNRLRLQLAGPELLASLKTLLRFTETLGLTGDLYSTAYKTARERAVAAVRKAQGRDY